MNSLASVKTFGGIDADADTLLEECFQDHEAYVQAKSHERFLVIGRKGSGKTAIFKQIITDRQPNLFTFGHTFQDYPWHYHDAQAQMNVPDEERYTHSWKYLILMTASKILLNHDQSQPWSSESYELLSTIESFVVDSYGSRDPDVTQLFSPQKTLKFSPSFKLGFGAIEAGATIEKVPVDRLPTHVQEINRTVADAVIRSMNPDNDYHICFDQLDLGFNPTDPKYAQRLTGLILAARDLRQMAVAAKKKFSVTIFLRDDIYQILRFEDKNKLTESYASRIEWDSQRTQWKLMDVMERRFAEVLNIPEDGAWAQVFDEEQEMRSRQNKYQHILDRTFRRPRDIIKFCNETLESFKSRTKDAPDNRFRNEDIISARSKYSDYLLNELDDEIFKHIPAYQAYIEVLKKIGTLQFTKSDFERVCNDRAELFDADAPRERGLEHLFDFSIIGYLRTGGGGGGSGYVWRYLDSRAKFDSSAVSFRIHAGFKEVLGLKQGGRDSSDDGDAS